MILITVMTIIIIIVIVINKLLSYNYKLQVKDYQLKIEI